MSKALRFPDLKDKCGIANRMTLKRAQDNLGFPLGQLVTPNCRVWNETEIDRWLTTRPAARKPSTRKAKPANVGTEATA